MTSKDVKDFIDNDKIADLYKKFEKEFSLIDFWATQFIEGDLLTEYELSNAMDKLTGCLMKLGTVAGALEALKEELEHNTEVAEYAKLEKVRAQDTSIVKATARNTVSDLRRYATDFRNYFYSAQSGIITCQSRVKRLSTEKGAKGVDNTGEVKPESEKKAW